MTLNFGNNLFPPRNEAIASYNYLDIESGTGMVNFYGVKELNGNTHRLTEATIDVGSSYEGGTNPVKSSAWTEWDEDGLLSFETEEFKVTKRIKGIAEISIPILGIDGDGVTLNDIKLVHVHSGGTTDLTTEIDLGKISNSSEDINTVPFLKTSEIPSTVIKAGDKIRLSMNVIVDTSALLLHNPAGTSVTFTRISGSILAQRTRLTVSIPFRLNL